jgi:hypothetical protein
MNELLSLNFRDWERMRAAIDALTEELESKPSRLRIHETEIIALDGEGRRLGKVIWASGGRESIGHGERWNSKMRCDQTFSVPNINTF